MNKTIINEQVTRSLGSVFYLEKSINSCVHSNCDFIFCMKEKEFDTSAGKAAFTFLRQVNQLQQMMNQKLIIYTNLCSETDVYSVFREHPDYDLLMNKEFLKFVEKISHYSLQCSLKEWSKGQIRNESQQAILLYKERRKLLEIYKSFHNDKETVWLSKRLT